MTGSVSIADVFAKLASIKLTPRQLFTYVPLPQELVEKLERIRKQIDVEKPEELDHVTLLYIPKAVYDVPQHKIDELVKAFREVGQDTPAIHAKVQGWAYFDGAEDHDNQPATALVALVDAPGLEDLHVELKSAARRLGYEPSAKHTFTPHFTFAYLKQGGRVQDLPRIDGEFDIDKVRFANADIHDIPLKGSLGKKAATFALNLPSATAVQEEPKASPGKGETSAQPEGK